uniref:Uncharacterized protein n=1 Tax=Anguilla anguilla TaxID=7936 RepID=A0A0E9WWL2_ANGAN
MTIYISSQSFTLFRQKLTHFLRRNYNAGCSFIAKINQRFKMKADIFSKQRVCQSWPFE